MSADYVRTDVFCGVAIPDLCRAGKFTFHLWELCSGCPCACNNFMDLCKGHTTLILNVFVNIMVTLSLHKSVILSCAPCRRSQVRLIWHPRVPNQSREALLWLDSMMIMWSCGRSYWSCIPTDGRFCTPLTSTKVCGHVYVSYRLQWKTRRSSPYGSRTGQVV